MDEGDAAHRMAWRREPVGPLDRAVVGRMDAGKDLDQRRLPRAVLAEQRMDLAAAQSGNRPTTDALVPPKRLLSAFTVRSAGALLMSERLFGDAPEREIVLLVAVGRRKRVFVATLGVYVVGRDQIRRLHEAARRLALDSAVDLVHRLIGLHLTGSETVTT